MTTDGVAFETLIYTDCVPGQGLQGTAGLQFQARSAGADRAAMALVQSCGLYEPPANWMRERRPLGDYPPSFAHVFDGVYATAAGVYRGREANGGREGNQLTHAVVATDPASYQLTRPAQLFGAPFWRTEPAATTDCDPVRHPWQPGPFDIEDAQAMVADRPDGPDLLGRLLTSLRALDRPDARRVLFISEDPAEVLRWISAATLLLPQRQALGIGFKVFTTNPAYATQPVVAVHPGWDSTTVTVDDDGGYAVFDLTSGRVSAIGEDPRARRWVRLLLDEDAYDVLDVVEMAAATERENPDEAFELAQSMVLRGRPLTTDGARIAVSWLRTTPPALLTPSRDVLVGKLLGDVKQWPEDVLVDLDEVARTGQIAEERMPEVRIALIGAELDRAARRGTASGVRLGPLPAGVWTGQHVRTCEDEVLKELRSARDASSFDAVLRVAHRFELGVDLDLVPEAVGGFVGWWADHPEAGLETTGWGAAAEPLHAALRRELRARVLAGRADEVGDGWWRHLKLHLPLPDDPLDAAALAAAMAGSDDARRERIADEAVRDALAEPEPGAVVQRTLAALWRRRALDESACLRLIELLPAGFPVGRFFDRIVRDLTGGSTRLRHVDVEVLRGLYDKELVARTEAVERLLRADEALARVHRRLPRAEVAELQEFPRTVSGTTGPVLQLWAPEIAEAMQHARHPEAVDRLLRQLPADVQRTFVKRLLERVRPANEVLPVVMAVQLAGADFLRPDLRATCGEFVAYWVRKASEKRRRQATELVDRVAAPADRAAWAARLDAREANSWSSRLRRRKRED